MVSRRGLFGALLAGVAVLRAKPVNATPGRTHGMLMWCQPGAETYDARVDIGPCAEDAHVWAWRLNDDGTRTLIGGPFPDYRHGMEWASKMHLHTSPKVTRTPAFKLWRRRKRD